MFGTGENIALVVTDTPDLAEAEQTRRVAQHELDDRNAGRAAEHEGEANARRELVVPKATHAPFEVRIAAAESVVREATSDLWHDESELSASSVVHRRSARRRVETATDVLGDAQDRLKQANTFAEPTRAALDDLHKIIADHHVFDGQVARAKNRTLAGALTRCAGKAGPDVRPPARAEPSIAIGLDR